MLWFHLRCGFFCKWALLILTFPQLSLCVLENSLTVDLLTAVNETIHRYLTIWVCMQSSAAIATALYTAHQTWKTEGIQSRALLTLLMKVDDGYVLDGASRTQLAADVAALSHVCAVFPQRLSLDTQRVHRHCYQ